MPLRVGRGLARWSVASRGVTVLGSGKCWNRRLGHRCSFFPSVRVKKTREEKKKTKTCRRLPPSEHATFPLFLIPSPCPSVPWLVTHARTLKFQPVRLVETNKKNRFTSLYTYVIYERRVRPIRSGNGDIFVYRSIRKRALDPDVSRADRENTRESGSPIRIILLSIITATLSAPLPVVTTENKSNR